MSWTTQSGLRNRTSFYREVYTLPTTGVGYSSVLQHIGPNRKVQNNYATFVFQASAVTGTNLDIALYGDGVITSTAPVLLLDAVVADITTTARVAGRVDLNAYPACFYWLGWTVDTDESLNTITVEVYY